MSIVVVTPPTVGPVDLATAMRHLRITNDPNVNDDDIQLLIDAATGQIDGPSGWLGRALITQTLELRLHRFGRRIVLPYPPLGEIASVKYDDTTGTEQTLDPAVYRVIGADRPALVLTTNSAWPDTSGQEECVRIQYTAGYGDAETDVPGPIRQAILLMVQMLYGMGSRDMFLSSETVVGVSTFQYSVNPNVALVLRSATDNLLSTYIVRVQEPEYGHHHHHDAFNEIGRFW